MRFLKNRLELRRELRGRQCVATVPYILYAVRKKNHVYHTCTV